MFSAYSSDLDLTSVSLLNRGSKVTELLKQENFSPLEIDEQFVVLFAGLNGLLDHIPTTEIRAIEKDILKKFSLFSFFDHDAPIADIHTQLTDSLIDVVSE